jgi:hypothetical protein
MAAALSRRGYAKHRKARGLPGATDRAVRRALRTGRIALEADGTIDPARADRQWRASTPVRVFQNGRPMAETLARLERLEEPDPDFDARGYWSLTKAMRRRFGVWQRQLIALDDAVQAEIERTRDDGFIPPTGVPQLDAYIDFIHYIYCARDALKQAMDPALARYRPLEEEK